MIRYITKINILIAILIFVALKLMDFHQSMTSFWVGPVLSAAHNFDFSNLNMYVNWDEIKEFSKLSGADMFGYSFTHADNLVLYDYLAKGLVVLVAFAKKLFFWQGDLEALQTLQYIVHIFISLLVINLLDKKYKKILFFVLYAINPVVLYFVNYPFYYFWQVIPSVIFVYWYFNQNKTKNLIFLFSVIFAFIYITRPTVLFLISLFYILYGLKDSYKKAFVSLGIFLVLINIAPKLSIGPWHTMYVGIGAYSNNYNIKLDDDEGYKYYKEKTGKVVNSGNVYKTEVKQDYYKVLKKRYFEIIKENPIMMLKNALLNIAESYSVGYKVGNPKVIYASAFLGIVMMLLLFYTKQYILFLAIAFAGGSFTPYFPPIGAYMYGSYILIVIGFIGIIEYFINQRELKDER